MKKIHYRTEKIELINFLNIMVASKHDLFYIWKPPNNLIDNLKLSSLLISKQ